MITFPKEGSTAALSLLETSKVEATLIAQFALAGHAVHSLTDGGYLVTKWGQSRHCPDLQALESFAKQTGAMR